jgi:Fe-S-cluster containining protein
MGEIIKYGFPFPYKTKKNGVCEMLTRDNRCKVYDHRPTICNIAELARVYRRNVDDFYKENIEMCNRLMDEDKIPLKFRIKT